LQSGHQQQQQQYSTFHFLPENEAKDASKIEISKHLKSQNPIVVIVVVVAEENDKAGQDSSISPK
jgi:hypothetical protein